MPSINKISCAGCGRAINEREITLLSCMVDALFAAFKYCERENRDSFTRSEIKTLFTNENATARFGDIPYFDSMLTKRGKGAYSIDRRRVRDFFAGRLAVATVAVINPITKDIRRENFSYIDEIKNLTEFLTANREYISVYRVQSSGQLSMF